jgi:Zn-dependent peptidase ImmA (M78 family)
VIPVIVINKSFSIERKRFTILHELGHILLNVEDCEDKTEEKFCNYFASEFLFPTKLVFKEFGQNRKHISLEELKSIQEKYGISVQAIVYKLSQLGIISQAKHKGFHIQLNTDKFLKEFVNKEVFPTLEKSNRFERLVYRALAQDEISISKAASITGKNIEELKNMSEII